MAHRKQIERRTFLQDRFEILIKRQKNRTATFNELTELDEMVNRDPELREKVIRENILMDDGSQPGDELNQPGANLETHPERPLQQSVFARIRAFLNRVFLSKTASLKQPWPAVRAGQMLLI